MPSPEPSPTPDAPSVHALGVDGLLVRFAERLSEGANRAALAFRAALEGDPPEGVEETATSLTSVHLRFDPTATDHARLRAALGPLLDGRDWYHAPLPGGRRLWRVPAAFCTDLAPQLEEAAALAGMSAAEAVAALCAAPLRMQTIGFAPGQPYLGELPEAWNIPRQTGLTPRVPEGALAVAIRQMVLFSVSTPTGWRHVGQTAVRLFRPEAEDPFLLRPGDEVMFHPVARDAFETLRAGDASGGAIAERLE
ncbi:MAG: 5-oxoprolinase subunit B family protein [Alkalilacustris sp.]